MAYTSNTDLKVYLGIAASNTDDDTLLTTLIARAQAMIDAYCRQTFEASQDSTRYFDPTRDVDGRTLYLDAPLCAITSVTNGDGNTVASTQYITEPRNSTPWHKLTLKANSSLAWTHSDTPENSISIVGKWAYSTTAPADVVQACTRLAAYLYRQKDNQGNDLDRPIAMGDGVLLMPPTLPRDVERILAPYRRTL